MYSDSALSFSPFFFFVVLLLVLVQLSIIIENSPLFIHSFSLKGLKGLRWEFYRMKRPKI